MPTSGNRLMIGFLCFSMVFFAVALLTQNDAPVDSHTDPRSPPVDSHTDPRSPDASDHATVTVSGSIGSGETGETGAAEATPTPASGPAIATDAARGDGLSLDSYDFEEPARHLKLPNRLREVSGLAMLAEDRLLAHDDERGTIVEVDRRDGSMVKDFKLGGPRGLVADDLEGIAAAEGRLYLVTSSGRLYEFGEGADGETVSYRRYETGVGRSHEIEGLAYDPDRRVLLLVSKNPRNRKQSDQVAIYHWSPDTGRLVEDGHLFIEASAFARRIDSKRFQPSGIELHPVSGNYFIVAARQHAVAEVTPQGEILDVIELKAGRHRQAEGITFASDNTLVIADEGAGKRATLSFYPVANGR